MVTNALHHMNIHIRIIIHNPSMVLEEVAKARRLSMSSLQILRTKEPEVLNKTNESHPTLE
jgi:hypothetical protein